MYCSVGCCTCHCNCVSTSRSSGTLVASSCVCGSICVCLGEREQHTPQGTADRRRQTGHREGRPATRKWQERVCRDATAERAVNLMKHCSCVTELEKGKKKKKPGGGGSNRKSSRNGPKHHPTTQHLLQNLGHCGEKLLFGGGVQTEIETIFFFGGGLCWAVLGRAYLRRSPRHWRRIRETSIDGADVSMRREIL